MTEFKMSAFARYPDGSTGDAFAEVSEKSAVACFAAMAAEVARWMPKALHVSSGEKAPEAVELTFGWSGEAASPSEVRGPDAPRDRGALSAEGGDPPRVSRMIRRGSDCDAARSIRGPSRPLPVARLRSRRRATRGVDAPTAA